eukprot:4225076-Lingulodinium_polyedra.AAC.1
MGVASSSSSSMAMSGGGPSSSLSLPPCAGMSVAPGFGIQTSRSGSGPMILRTMSGPKWA